MEESVTRGGELVRFVSFEETLSILAALATAAIAFRLFKVPLLTSTLIGAVAAGVIAYVTLSEFTLADDVVSYRNRFRATDFPLSYVQKVGMETFWGGLPGHIFVFILRRPPAQVNGYSQRTGLVSWPSATEWVEAVNSAIQKKSAPMN